MGKSVRPLLTAMLIGAPTGAAYGFVISLLIDDRWTRLSVIAAGSLVIGATLVRVTQYWYKHIPRFWPMRIRRHCYDKPHRCPGWSGGGRKLAPERQTICPSGSFAPYMYEQRLWKWRFHRCDKCGTVALPVVVKYFDPFWWVKWEMPMWKRDLVWWWKERRDGLD